MLALLKGKEWSPKSEAMSGFAKQGYKFLRGVWRDESVQEHWLLLQRKSSVPSIHTGAYNYT